LHLLNDLLKAGNKWKWSKKCNAAFEEAKKLLVSAPDWLQLNLLEMLQLMHGIGAAISHVFPDGQECLITFTSCAVSKAEKNYGQIEKEALFLVYGI